jgi:hypothetical protein
MHFRKLIGAATCNGPVFFLKHTGELCIIELRKGWSKNRPNTNTKKDKKEKKGRNKKK